MDWTVGLDCMDSWAGLDSFKLFFYGIFALIRLNPVLPLKDAGRL